MSESQHPVLYVILNGELNMSPGKGAAQAVHAAMLLEGNYPGLFVSSYKRSVIVLEAENGETIYNLLKYLEGAEIFADSYVDEYDYVTGKNFNVTAMAVEPIDYNDEEKRSIFANFPLFQGHVEVKYWHEWSWDAEKLKIKNGTQINDGKLFDKLKKELS